MQKEANLSQNLIKNVMNILCNPSNLIINPYLRRCKKKLLDLDQRTNQTVLIGWLKKSFPLMTFYIIFCTHFNIIELLEGFQNVTCIWDSCHKLA